MLSKNKHTYIRLFIRLIGITLINRLASNFQALHMLSRLQQSRYALAVSLLLHAGAMTLLVLWPSASVDNLSPAMQKVVMIELPPSDSAPIQVDCSRPRLQARPWFFEKPFPFSLLPSMCHRYTKTTACRPLYITQPPRTHSISISR